jgi:hypothetical protein
MVLFIVIHEIFLKINNHGKGDNYVNFIIMSLIILVVLQLKNIINTPILLSKIKLNEKIEMTDEKITISSDNDEIFDCNWENVNIQEIEYFKYKGKKTMNGFTLVNEGNKNEIYQISFNIFIFDEVIGTILSKLIEKKKIILSL